MKMLQNVLNYIININGFDITIKEIKTSTIHNVRCAQSNYFRKPSVDENITSSSRQYVVSESGVSFVPRRGDSFRVSATEFYAIEDVEELRAMGNIIGYRITVR
jgi:hypothetical protein